MKKWRNNTIIMSNFSLTLGVFTHRAYQQCDEKNMEWWWGSKKRNKKFCLHFWSRQAKKVFPLLSKKTTINVNWRGINDENFLYLLSQSPYSDNVIVVAFNAFESREIFFGGLRRRGGWWKQQQNNRHNDDDNGLLWWRLYEFITNI